MIQRGRRWIASPRSHFGASARQTDASAHFTFKTAAALPNPFGPRTTIRYTLDARARVALLVADPSGRIVRRLASGAEDAGAHQVEWDGRDDEGRELPAGIYLYVLHAGDRHEMGKLVRVR